VFAVKGLKKHKKGCKKKGQQTLVEPNWGRGNFLSNYKGEKQARNQ